MWIELHDTAREHPKIIKLARDLGIKRVQALGHVVCLWTWVIRMAPDGRLDSFDRDDLEVAAEWEGKPGAFIGACVVRGLIDDDDGVLSIHDWIDFAGSLKAAGRARASRERKQTEKAEKEQKRAQTCARVRTRAVSALTDRPTRPTDQTDQTRPNDGAVRSREPRSAQPTLGVESPEVARIPLLAGKEFVVTEADVAEWRDAYPAVDVVLEVKGLRQWSLANPTKRKRNGRAFITRNLARKQERGGPAPPQQRREQSWVNAHMDLMREGNDGNQGRDIGNAWDAPRLLPPENA